MIAPSGSIPECATQVTPTKGATMELLLLIGFFVVLGIGSLFPGAKYWI